MRTKEFVLKELFDFPSISSGMTEEFARRNKGDIPVYGGRKTETPLSYIKADLEGIKYFNNCLGWNREGSIGYVFYHKHKFTTNDHHRPMILKDQYKDYINLEYCRIVIQNAILTMGLSWGKTASKEKVSKLKIKIPVDDNGIPDINLQEEYALKLNKIEEYYSRLEEYYNKLNKCIIAIDDSFKVKNIKLLNTEIFETSIGKRVLKKDVVDSGIPLYSANPVETFGYVEQSNLSYFDRPSILWGIDGNFVWNYIEDSVEFATTDHCGRLQIIDERILPKFVYYALRKDAPNEGFSRTYRASLKRIRESISIDIPVDEFGNFDVNKQKLIIKKYEALDEIKESIKAKLQQIIESKIDFN